MTARNIWILWKRFLFQTDDTMRSCFIKTSTDSYNDRPLEKKHRGSSSEYMSVLSTMSAP